jgi:pre-mRNA-processing factor 17
MSLVEGYSSEEENNDILTPTNDAFGLTSIPSSKKMRLEQLSATTTPVVQSAPDVLLEVLTTFLQFLSLSVVQLICIHRTR